MRQNEIATEDLGRRPVNLERVATLAREVLAAEGRPELSLSVTIVDDPRMAELHEQFSQVPGPTDVLAFPLLDDDVPLPPGDGGPPRLLGEVVVSSDTAAREAEERGLSFEHELLLYVTHGTLHLLGYDDHDPEERARMEARQEELLTAFLTRQPSAGEGGRIQP